MASVITANSYAQSNTAQQPLRIAVAGIAHGHVSWILNKKEKNDVIVAAVFDKNKELGLKYAERFNFSKNILYTDLAKMLDEVKPQAVVAFGSIYDHLSIVEQCAPRGIHVMVEKPLATNIKDALRMKELAQKHKIYLLTNYETSWYSTTEKSYQLINDSNYIGQLTKAVFHHGHEGPKEIGVGPEFLEWLTDPVQNGGGALIDFGCYGANIMTYLTRGEEPLSVSCVTRQYKPGIYPKVDDEATIIVNYKNSQAIIQGSWNWPFGRKDMQLYGKTGYIITKNNNEMSARSKSVKEMNFNMRPEEVGVYTDPFKYFAEVVNGKLKMPEYSLYSLENNMLVVKILDAARVSAQTGRVVKLSSKN